MAKSKKEEVTLSQEELEAKFSGEEGSTEDVKNAKKIKIKTKRILQNLLT